MESILTTAIPSARPGVAVSPQGQNGVRLVVGASRGIGLALTAAQLAMPHVRRVIATYRAGGDLDALADLSNRHGSRLLILPVDVSSSESLSRLSRRLQTLEGGFDIAIHAAGILHENGIRPEKSLLQCDPRHLVRLFEVNSVGPLMIAKLLFPLQSRQRRFVFAALSAMVGSIGDNRLGGWYGYRASKSALNQFMKTLSNECKINHPRAAVVAVHPGTTDTRLSRPFQTNVPEDKLYSPALTARRILRIVENVGVGHSGRFYNWDGSVIPW